MYRGFKCPSVADATGHVHFLRLRERHIVILQVHCLVGRVCLRDFHATQFSLCIPYPALSFSKSDTVCIRRYCPYRKPVAGKLRNIQNIHIGNSLHSTRATFHIKYTFTITKSIDCSTIAQSNLFGMLKFLVYQLALLDAPESNNHFTISD